MKDPVAYPAFIVESADNKWTINAISAPMAAILAIHTYQPRKLATFLTVQREDDQEDNVCVVDTVSILELFGMEDAKKSLIEQN